jgi:prepilin-type N-terminal cleavage/methylation domain-containing protein
MNEKRGIIHAMLRRSTRGFTLIEVLIAIVIFSLSLLALVPLLSTAMSIDRENYLNVTSRATAADVLDTLMGGGVPIVGNPSTVNDQGVDITTSWAVAPAGNLDTIAVTVTYAYKGQTKTFVLTSQRAAR